MTWLRRLPRGEWPCSAADEDDLVAAVGFAVAKRRSAPDPDAHWESLAADLHLICTNRAIRALFAGADPEADE